VNDCGCHSHNGFRMVPKEPGSEGSICNGVDGTGASPYLDKVDSVSGLEQERDIMQFDLEDEVLEEQSERFHNGS